MLKFIASYVTYDLLKLVQGSPVANAIEFSIYETIKIFLLLAVIIFVVSTMRSYFPPEKTRRILSHKKEFIGNILVALFAGPRGQQREHVLGGTPTPLLRVTALINQEARV